MAERGLRGLAVNLLEGLGRQLWGFPPLLMSYIVDQLGPVRAVLWFLRNMPRYERTLKALGPLRTHLACVAVSLHNGCRYCAYGHAYAAELHYFRQHDRLFPVDAATMAGWIELPVADLRSRMRSTLEQAGLQVEVLWVDLALTMTDGRQGPMDRDESRIAHLVRMFAVLNAVGIAGKVPVDEAHDPLNKDIELKGRLAELRASL